MVYSGNADSEDQCFVECSDILLKHWNTYKNRYTDTPRRLFRAIAIHAVSAAAAANGDLEAAVAYGLRSLGQHPNTANEGPILQEYYRETSDKIEQRAIGSWRLNAITPFLGESFARVYISHEKALRFAERQKKTPIVKSTQVSEVH